MSSERNEPCRAGSPHPATPSPDCRAGSPHPAEGSESVLRAAAGCGDPALQQNTLTTRKHLRRLGEVWSDTPLYFLTVCVAQRRPLLATPAVAALLIDTWREADERHGWTVGRYVVMPDHVHFFARPKFQAKTLTDFMRDWKKWTTRQITAALNPSVRKPEPVWQPEYFDHLLRSADSYSEKWEYVFQNPVRANLVAIPEAWPHSGEITPLRF